MVKNRKELLEVAGANANQLKKHLRNAVRSFINEQGVSPEELAYVLGITNEEMFQIIDGDGNITIDVLSKLLVATDLAVEIKPISMTPLKKFGREMPRSGGFPMAIPTDEDGMPLPPPPGFMGDGFGPGVMLGGPNPFEKKRDVAEKQKPMRDEHGRFIGKGHERRKQATQRPSDLDENPYFSMSNSELANIIRQNIWDGEIDLSRANHEQLVDFVTNKERIMRERSERNNEEAKQEDVKPGKDNGDALNSFLEMLGNVAREAENNPSLMETISRFMPRRG